MEQTHTDSRGKAEAMLAAFLLRDQGSYRETAPLGSRLNSERPQKAIGFDLASLIDDIKRRHEQQEAREAGLNEFCEASLSDSSSEAVNEPGKVYETLQDLPTSPTREDDEREEPVQVAGCCSACVII